ncbi:MAG: cyclic nucleotide-binding domain-containing protein [Thermoanaerobaculia bacterium]|nr:cyclic nucleotide-binding domain-containing protein [Thermoanaerobaculia bacterium]
MNSVELFRSLSAFIEPMLLHQGDRLFNAGEAADGIYLIQRGRVQLTYKNAAGSPVTERLVHGGQILGLGPLFAERPWGASAEVISTTRAGFVRKDAVLRFLDEHPEGRLAVLKLLSQDVDRCLELIRHRSPAMSKAS